MSNRTELFEVALDSLPEGVALLDAEGGVAFWSRTAEAITGFAAATCARFPRSWRRCCWTRRCRGRWSSGARCFPCVTSWATK